MPQTRPHSLRALAERLKHVNLYDTSGLSDTTKHSLKMAIISVIFGQVWAFIVTGAAWTGYLREVIRADDFALGLIAAIPVAANAVQLLAAYLMQRLQKRRFFFLFFGILGRSIWLPLALVPYILPEAMAGFRMYLVMVFVVFISASSSFINVGFASLMADIVPMRIRGKFFTTRHAISLTTGLVGGLLASFVVDKVGIPGYSIVLFIAGIFGVIDICCYFLVDFPPMEVPPGENQGFFRMVGIVLKDRNYLRVIATFACWSFTLNLASPFYYVHMLENLKMSYTQITMTNQIASNVVTLLVVSRWGKPMDRFGSKAIIQFASLFVLFAPLLWLFTTPQSIWLIAVNNIISGIFFPAVDFGFQNVYFSAAGKQNRAMYVAMYSAIVNLLGVAVANALGGFLVKSVFTPWAATGFGLFGFTWTKYHYIIALGGLLRVLCIAFMFPRIKDPEGTPWRLAVSTMAGETRSHWQRTRFLLRAKRIRRQYHAQQQKRQHDKSK